MTSKLQTILVGDIHGCLEEFEELLEKIKYDPEKHDLISVGDLIDRGPFSKKVVEKVRKMGIKVVKGNHDDKGARFRKHERKLIATGRINPMREKAERAQAKGSPRLQEWMSLSEEEVDWLDSLPVKIHLSGNWWAIHGGLEPAFKFEKQDPKQIIRCRWVDNVNLRAQALLPDKSAPPNTTYWSELWPGPENIIYGHCVHSLKDVRIDKRPAGQPELGMDPIMCIGIDTGCVFGGRLTALFFPQMEVVQVQARREYESLKKSDGDE